MRAWLILLLWVAASCVALVLVHAPSALLFGALVGALLFALTSRQQVAFPTPLFLAGQGIIGVTVGASVDFDALGELGSDGVPIVLVTVATLLLSVGAGQLLRLHRGVTPVTASFASVAGGASGMTALAEDLGADSRVVTVIQYLRVLIILLAMPLVVSIGFGVGGGSSSGTSSGVSLAALAFTVVAVVVGVWGGRLARLPSPAVLGGLVAGAALAPLFGVDGVPTALQNVGYVLIGVQVGLKFTLESVKAIGRMLPTAVLSIAITIAGCAGLGWLLTLVTGASALDAYLATTPGGLYAVLATATATSADVTFVTAVQMIRLLLVLLVAPFVARWFQRRR